MSDKMNIEELTNSLAASVQTNIDLIKLETVECTSVIGSSLSIILFIGSFILLFVFFLSLYAGYYLSHCFNDSFTGFALVAGFYFLISILLILFRKRLIETPIRNKIIRSIYKK